jgi:hypothetical protein
LLFIGRAYHRLVPVDPALMLRAAEVLHEAAGDMSVGCGPSRLKLTGERSPFRLRVAEDGMRGRRYFQATEDVRVALQSSVSTASEPRYVCSAVTCRLRWGRKPRRATLSETNCAG